VPVSPSSDPPAIPTRARAAAAPGPLFAADGTAPAPVRALADAIPLILWTSDPGGRLTSINREWEAFTGQPASEALASGSHAYVHRDDLPVVAAAWRERLRGARGRARTSTSNTACATARGATAGTSAAWSRAARPTAR
jgi:PAS domain-containing protein